MEKFLGLRDIEYHSFKTAKIFRCTVSVWAVPKKQQESLMLCVTLNKMIIIWVPSEKRDYAIA